MGRKKILERKLKRLENKKAALVKRSNESEDVAEVRSINEQLQDIADEMQDVKDELQDIIDAEGDGNGSGSGDGDGSGEGGDGEEERNLPPDNPQLRNGNILGAYGIGVSPAGEQRDNRPYASLEYRTAWKEFVQRGTPIPEDVMTRAAGDTGPTVAEDLGAIIPQTIMDEFIKEASKVYGQIYAKVRKLNIQGGVKIPISKLKAQFKWIEETKPSTRVKAGDIKEYVTFEYNMGEIRISHSILASIVALDVFEKETVKLMLEAWLEAMDKAIISGTGIGQPLGITKDTRVTKNKNQIIELTEEEFGDWTAWRKKLFAKVPLSKRGQGEFLFPNSTVESYLLTMKDKNDRPLFKEATELSMGNTAGSFFGRNTDLVEPDVIADFDTATAGDIVGIFWVPGDYVINTNMVFGIKRYTDEDTNEIINKALTIVDGKIGDTSGCYLIKKAASKAGGSGEESSETGN